MNAASRAKRGFTLIEVLVVMGVAILLFGLVIRIFFHSQDAVAHTVDKIEAVQSARHLVDKLTPIVAMSSNPTQIGEQSVRLHLPEGGLDEEIFDRPTWIDLITPHDFLGPNLQPITEFVPYRDLNIYRYRIDYVPEDGMLLQRRMTDDGEEIDDTVSPRILGSQLLGLQFWPIFQDQSLIEVRVKVEQDTMLRQDVGANRIVESSATLYVPAESMR